MKLSTNRYLLIIVVFIAVISLAACSSSSDRQPEFEIEGYVEDGVNFERISGATVVLESNGDVVMETSTSANGTFRFEGVEEGTYVIRQMADGYRTTSSSSITVAENGSNTRYFAPMMTVDDSITQPVSAVTGAFTDADGSAVANATIAISAQDESVTNGYFIATVTNENGEFAIGAIPLEAPDGSFLNSAPTSTLIEDFKIRIIAEGKLPVVIENVSLLQDVVFVNNESVELADAQEVTVFEDNFTLENAWETTGFWHRQSSNSGIVNEAFPEYVRLAPDDNSNAAIPNAASGSHFYWYGDPQTGNFMGEQDDFDSPGSGGTSLDSNSGTLTSPVISMPASDFLALSFQSWFEIESVNPNSSGFDLMEIRVIQGNQTVPLGRINPFSDPILPDRQAIPFTSGGFNRAPIWNLIEVDLSEFRGEDIRIQFAFDTVDELYNGFRGWMIDDLRITDMTEVETNLRTVNDYKARPAGRSRK
ncbi:MAG: carboxypeptidase regulatory-like domain-containing protein [Balneolales bacterium]|nr:carboxypeptidase regulatory-like domain-containing protein [Balneolales bacterium]